VAAQIDTVTKQVFMWQALRTMADFVGGVDPDDQDAVLTWLGNVGLIRADRGRRGQVVLTARGVTTVWVFAKAAAEYADERKGAAAAAKRAGIAPSPETHDA
jgi:hypothetical protein